MADSFGIYREEVPVAPAVQGVFKGTPSLIRGKGFASNIKKKALGDVSNTVSQKVLIKQLYDVPEKVSTNSCSGAQLEASVSCKPVVEKKELLETSGICSSCHYFTVSDYDILPRSERFSNIALDQLAILKPCKSYSPNSSFSSEFDLSLPLIPDLMDEPFGKVESTLMDVTIPSLDDSDFSDLSF